MSTDICALCARPLGKRVEKHHLVPKTEGGRETVLVHPICHRKIHAVFSERELAVAYQTPEKLRCHPDIAKFIVWLAGKPVDFHKRTEPARRR